VSDISWITRCRVSVAELHAVEQRRVVRVEKVAVQPLDRESVVDRPLECQRAVHRAPRIALVDQPEQALQRGVQERAVARLGAVEADELGVAQRLQAVAQGVDVDWRIGT